eukprot:1518737-Rhodomonas_salina.2
MNFDLGANLDHPSYFEVAAQERVIPALFAAFEHALTVVAARHPSGWEPHLVTHLQRRRV